MNLGDILIFSYDNFLASARSVERRLELVPDTVNRADDFPAGKEMTGQTVEAVAAKLKDQRMHTVMQELNVDRQAFRTAMQAKVSERIRQAAANGTITPERFIKCLSQEKKKSYAGK